MSASSSTMSALLPPSSRLTRFSVRPAASPTIRPTAVEPVKEIIATSGWAASAPPGSASPGSMCSTPSGSPASSNSRASSTPPETGGLHVGLQDDGVAEGQRGRDRPGRQDQREVPRADHADHAQRHPLGDALPAGLAGRQQLAPGLGGQRRRLPQLPEHQLDLERRLAGDGPALADQPASTSARLSSSSRAARRISAARCGPGWAAHSGWACFAAAAAAPMSSALARPTVASTAPVAGSTDSSTPPRGLVQPPL